MEVEEKGMQFGKKKMLNILFFLLMMHERLGQEQFKPNLILQ